MALRAGDAGAAGDRPATGESDEELVRGCARGEDEAFVRLLERYRARVVQFVRWRLGARSVWAEDVAQEIFVRLHRHASSFEGRSSFRTWLYALALNVCRSHTRREWRTRGRQGGGEEALAELPDGAPLVFERLEREEQEARVREAIERLSEVHRVVLHLRGWEEMSYEQMAELLQVPVGTIRSRLYNARAALAQELAHRRPR